MNDLKIRPETTADTLTIYRLTEEAFAPMPFSEGDEADCVVKLRLDGDLSLSLVATADEKIVGHIAFSPVQLDGAPGKWIGLGPVSVWPRLQKRGIGSALIESGLNTFSNRDVAGCILIGDPTYYQRFGFIGDGRITYRSLPPQIVQWLAFGDEKPAGNVLFSPGLE